MRFLFERNIRNMNHTERIPFPLSATTNFVKGNIYFNTAYIFIITIYTIINYIIFYNLTEKLCIWSMQQICTDKLCYIQTFIDNVSRLCIPVKSKHKKNLRKKNPKKMGGNVILKSWIQQHRINGWKTGSMNNILLLCIASFFQPQSYTHNLKASKNKHKLDS